MSRVAVIVVVGLCYMAGCSKSPQPILKVHTENSLKIQDPDIFVITDPNELAALLESAQKHQSNKNRFAIKPPSDIDFKIIAVKPNPDIDYKILNPMQNTQRQIHELFQQKPQEMPGEAFLVP
jgi:hypothetical protein